MKTNRSGVIALVGGSDQDRTEIANWRAGKHEECEANHPASRVILPMHWYDYVGCFFAGAFLANAVPHFVHGISGDRFPTPFASPPGKGLSSSTVNMLWSLFNLVVGYILFRVENVPEGGFATLIPFFAGIAAVGIWLSVHFTKKHST